MWKKTETPPESNPRPAQPPARPQPGRRSEELATIGPSITIKGDLTGGEDLLIQGKIDGKIVLEKNNVTVGKEGRVKADIHGRSVRVEGEVRGNLFGTEEVVIRASGRVHGNLKAPRVTLENGSRFKGSIDMESGTKDKEKNRPTPPRPAERQEERKATTPEKSGTEDTQAKLETQARIGSAPQAS